MSYVHQISQVFFERGNKLLASVPISETGSSGVVFLFDVSFLLSVIIRIDQRYQKHPILKPRYGLVIFISVFHC